MKKVYKYSQEGNLLHTYNSQTSAANSFNIDEGTIRKAIKNNTLTKGYYWSNDKLSNFLDDIPKEAISHSNKILLLDIETSPSIAYTFPVWNTNIRHNQIIEDWYILCYTAKWLDKPIISDTITIHDKDDFNLVSNLWTLLDEAEIVVTHNVRFDINKINSKFLVHGLTPPSPYKTFDTLKTARKEFGFTYNNLDYLLKQLGLDGKINTELSLWIKCMKREKKALVEMQKYCDNDVIALEKLYLKLRPWDNAHPNMGIYDEQGDIVCTKCGSSNLEYMKDTFTNTRVYKLYQCKDCKGYSRSRKGENKLNVLISK